MNILINFRHGLGDAVQLSIVLKHLQKYRSNWNVDIAALVGKHSAYRGLCRKIYVLEKESPPCCEYQQRFTLNWDECHAVYSDSPSTKAERCLREEFGITPDRDLCTYTVNVDDKARELARKYLNTICTGHSALPTPNSKLKYPVVLVHYEGNTSADMKNIPTDVIRRLCDDIIEEGFAPVILDWDYRTPLADGVRIHCPDQRSELWHRTGTGDAESLAALIELSTLMVGVDSGPLHVAGATSIPTLGVWTRHHPLHYFAHADNVTHLVPRNHLDLLRGDRQAGESYFSSHYCFQFYDDLETALRSATRARLQTAKQDVAGMRRPEATASTDESHVFTNGFWVRTDMAEQDLVVVQDVAERDAYHIDEIPMKDPVVFDVGAHIGCFAKRIHQRAPAARIVAVECCPENIAALRRNIGDVATVVQAAVTYETDIALLNAVYKDCVSTGGSIVVSQHELRGRVAAATNHDPSHNGATAAVAVTDTPSVRLGEYWPDFRTVQTLTLEDLMQQHGFDHIDILKLDCEGSEYSILRNSPSLDRIGLIVGEYHGRERFDWLLAERFSGWKLRIIKEGEFGIFWLENPAYLPPLARGGQGGSRCLQSDARTTRDARSLPDASGTRQLLESLHSRSYREDYYLKHKAGGLDYLEYGQWQRNYGRWLVECLGWKGQRLLDMGCACGAIVRGFYEAGANVAGVDVNEHTIQLGRQTWPDLASRLAVCDAVNLHLFDDGAWDGVHSTQVAEHWKPSLVPHILAELHRVTRPGGLFFCVLDTEDLFARQGRTIEPDDPTPVCIRPMSWWDAQLNCVGWRVCTSEFDAVLRSSQ